jgi:hypothetical protein
MDVSLKQVVDAFAEGLQAIDAERVPYKSFKPGVGPYGEADAIRLSAPVTQNVTTYSPSKN